ncbi:vacuolar sorting protein [Saudi moumouvirus]|uniref:Vacuolar sorting protein n=1 Tax=Moumouvirus sp. 'Monve' TaxID=1128131 RepID=H2ED30_9VIRU|nr:vacuolar sorting protein [Moumouvirus Monve]AQN68681.1 vacuolar sorting protein [Saudi moumouvirus]
MESISIVLNQQNTCYLVDLLRKYNITNTLYIEKKLLGIISSIIKYSVLSSCGITNIKILEENKIIPTKKSCIILSHNYFDFYKNHCIQDDTILFFYRYHPNFVVNHDFDILNFGFIPINKDLLSLEDEYTFNIFTKTNNEELISLIADHIIKFLDICGLASYMEAHGRISKLISGKILDKYKYTIANINFNIDMRNEYTQMFESIIIMDRTCDWNNFFTFCTNYEFLLDYIFGIRQSKINYNNNVNDALFINEDVLYNKLKDKNINELGKLFVDEVNDIQTYYNKKNNLTTIQQYSGYVKELAFYKKRHYNLSKHVDISKKICGLIYDLNLPLLLEYEKFPKVEFISEFKNENDVFRLLCIYLIKNTSPDLKKIENILDKYFNTRDKNILLTKLKQLNIINNCERNFFPNIFSKQK